MMSVIMSSLDHQKQMLEKGVNLASPEENLA